MKEYTNKHNFDIQYFLIVREQPKLCNNLGIIHLIKYELLNNVELNWIFVIKVLCLLMLLHFINSDF